MRAGSWRRSWTDVVVVGLAAAVDLYVYAGDRQLRWGGSAPVWLVPSMTGIVFTALLSRWRRPVAVFAVQWTYGLVGLVMPGYAPFAGLLLALHAVACHVRTSLSVTALASSTLIFALHNYNAAVAGDDDVVPTMATLSAVWVVITVAVWAVGRRTYAVHHHAMRALEARAREAAQALRAERLRLARDLHDIVAHSVTAMILHSAGARTLVGREDERVRDALLTIEAAGVQAMQELHRLLGTLRSVDSDVAPSDLSAQPGLDEVPGLVARTRDGGLNIESTLEGRAATLDPSVDAAAYRVVQEALTNAVKHGGPDARVSLELVTDDVLTITVRSSRGVSVGPHTVPSGGLGLRGLAERVTLVGGRFHAGPNGDDFVVHAELPTSTAFPEPVEPRGAP